MAIYAYIAATGKNNLLDANAIHFTGAWNGSTTYVYRDAADDGLNHLWLSLETQSGKPIPSIFESTNYGTTWAHLVQVQAGPPVPPTPSTSSVQPGDWLPSDWAGTNYSAALFDTAITLAETGTNLAQTAYELALLAIYRAGTASGTVFVDLSEVTSLAQTALETAWSGTAAGNQAYTVAGEAYTLAIVGTNAANAASQIAGEAYTLATVGTNAASAASQIAGEAYTLAIVGTNAANAANTLAGEAYTLAIAGTTAASSADMWGRDAFSLAVVGTNAAEAANATAVLALNTAWTGTDAAHAAGQIAGEAYALASLGTVPPFLDDLQDVNAPSPFTNQVLVFNGTAWVAGDVPTQVAPGAFTLFLDEALSGTAGYYFLLTNPSGDSEITLTNVVGGSSPSFVFVGGWIGAPLNRTFVQSGVWEFNTYASVDDASRPVAIITELYTRSSAGSEVLLLSGTSSGVASTSPVVSTTLVSAGSFSTNLTDSLVAKYYFQRGDSPSVNATIYVAGSNHDSHFHTPIGLAHNDLGGLQGGNSTTNEFYHITQSENEALNGADSPSSTNVFVTSNDGRLVAATTALVAAWAGTNAANAASQIAGEAYTLATVGTNAAEAARQIAGEAYTLATVGTNAANAVNSVAGQALTLAWAGTNAAKSADMWGRDAFSLAVVGTNAASAASTIAVTALNTAWAGTSAARSADMWGRDAFSLAVVGTNAANAVNTTAFQALNTAWAGTTAAALSVPLSGGTMTGNLVVPNVQVSSGTVPSSLASSGTILYNFSGAAYQTTTVDTNVRVSGTNMASVREIAVILKSTGSGTRFITYDTNFSFFGNTPPATVTTKDVIIALTSTGNTLSTVLAAAAVAQ